MLSLVKIHEISIGMPSRRTFFWCNHDNCTDKVRYNEETKTDLINKILRLAYNKSYILGAFFRTIFVVLNSKV